MSLRLKILCCPAPNGKCAYCNEDNTSEAWCQTCDPDMTIRGWTSGNRDIDICMKEFQLRVNDYEHMIEWIPFDRLDNIKKIGEGGFGTVFSERWLDGIRKVKKIKNDNDEHEYVKSREQCSTVALKTLSSSKENSYDLLNEFKNLLKCGLWGNRLKIYGLTHNAEKNEYFMTKLKLLLDVSSDLRTIHYAGYIHADFHSGNILQDGIINKNLQSYVTDLGLSKKYNGNDLEGKIYGVMPYVAPEVLLGQKLTAKADIYGFGVIMSEISNGQRPFDGYEFNTGLALKISKQCMDPDPQKRPDANDAHETLYSWNKYMERSDSTNEIKMQFLNTDKVIKELPTISPKHPDFIYTSKIIDTQRISHEIEVSQPFLELPDELKDI
ncbi:kinase-like domain-containing protein [Gigaspora rosea]|uniref:Kinase-like domain-containing protein n=1 Tax=Gigaspora rosea TaxID=44941 RepID=A0A397W8T7_9GLOM|nr:kinase-like domain-containing protein [Gigaspora rosea]